MDIPDYIKNELTVLNFLSLLVVIAVCFFIFNRRTLAYFIGAITFALFILCSTEYFPKLLLREIESTYHPFGVEQFKYKNDTVLIHVLGGGYTLDQSLPANDQLALGTLGRLVEGIRIYRMLPNSILVTSGSSKPGFESQASVVKRAAVSLGIDSARIVILETPTTTWEEADALLEKFGTTHPVVVVTDAVHLPRAIHFFERHQFNVTGAPSNHLSKHNPKNENKWWPNSRNIKLSNIILHEYLGFFKGYFLNPQTE